MMVHIPGAYSAPRTVAGAHERLDTLEGKIDAILAALVPSAPAKARTTRKVATPKARQTARKAAPVKAAPKARRSQTAYGLGKGLTRKEWNRALTGLARRAGQHADGVSVISVVTGHWTEAAALRTEGFTPEAALAYLLEG